MACQKCNSGRILTLGGKTSDMCFARFYQFEKDEFTEGDGYVPHGLNIGGGDYINIQICMQCGQVQGEWPVDDETVIESIERM